jgi:hypothetical protein
MPKKKGKDSDAKPKTKSNTAEKSVYVEIALEKRVNSDNRKAHYNKYKDNDEQREFFSKTRRNRDKKTKKIQSARSKDKGDWDVTNVNIEDDKVEKTEDTDDYGDHTLKNIFEDFPEIDVSKLVQGGCGPCVAIGAKKGGAPRRKSPKRSRKKSAKKSKKKSPKRSRKKLSRKKS